MIHRNITQNIFRALEDTPALFLSGVRQTGKSTLAKYISQTRAGSEYLTMDDLAVLNSAKIDPQGFVSGLPEKVIIDEVQRVPEIMLPIKAEIDKNRRPGRFFLTGSANVFLLPKISESLAGRIEILTMWPFSQGELGNIKETFIDEIFSSTLKKKSLSFLTDGELWQKLIIGGYPESVKRSTPGRRNAWFKSYIANIIQRDIRDLSNIDGLTHIPNLFQLIAGRCAELLNYSDLSRSLQIPQSSLKRYFSLLESAFLIHRLQPWHGNVNARIVKSSKIYVSDTGLISHLMGIDASRMENDLPLAGHLLENFVVNELKKQIEWSSDAPGMYHFRSHTGHEVDVVLENRQGKCIGIEIKSSANVRPADIKNLKFFRDALGKKFHRGILLYRGKSVLTISENICAVPLEYMWS